MNKPLISAGELIRTSWDQFRNDWRFNLEGAVRFLIANIIAALPGAFIVKTATDFTPTNTVIFLLFTIASSVLLIHTSYSFTHALLRKAADQKVTALDNAIGWKYFWPAIWVGIIQGFAILGATILLIIPGIWLAGRLAFANVVLLDEDKRGVEALKRSSELVKGRWWAAFWRSLASGLVFGILMVLVTLILGAFIGLLVGGLGQASEASTSSFGQMLSAVVQSFFIPLFLIFTVRLYKNLKETA
ncbi:MAG: hypothetical protein KC582_02360 [Candidatus Magasanikbacteria bacterium]|nr:hypothetical protein [Candidatus Magasanikbacteria bacterium]